MDEPADVHVLPPLELEPETFGTLCDLVMAEDTDELVLEADLDTWRALPNRCPRCAERVERLLDSATGPTDWRPTYGIPEDHNAR